MSLDAPPGEYLVGRTAIVTGGWGIGRAIARRLARDGARVVVAARSGEDAFARSIYSGVVERKFAPRRVEPRRRIVTRRWDVS